MRKATASKPRKTAGTGTANPISMLKEDHRNVKDLFDQFEKAKDERTQVQLAKKAIEELKIHSTLEEEIFYPGVWKMVKDEEIMNEASEEHHVVHLLIDELEGGRLGSDTFHAKIAELSDAVAAEIARAVDAEFTRASSAALLCLQEYVGAQYSGTLLHAFEQTVSQSVAGVDFTLDPASLDLSVLGSHGSGAVGVSIIVATEVARRVSAKISQKIAQRIAGKVVGRVAGRAGSSLLPVIEGREAVRIAESQERVNYEVTHEDIDWALRSLRSDAWKAIFTWDRRAGTVREEAYDLRADPLEQHDLAQGKGTLEGLAFDPAFCREIERVRDELQREGARQARPQPCAPK